MTALQPPPIALEGRHIRLIPLHADDLPELFEALNDPRVYAGGWGGGPAGYRDTVESFIELGTKYFLFDRNIVYGVRAPDGTLVGTSTLGDFDLEAEHAHIGWTEDITGVREFEDLPKNAQDYVLAIEKISGSRISAIGVGPGRDAIVVRHDLID